MNTVEGESSYALNENLGGIDLSGVPSDTVLIFEVKCEAQRGQTNENQSIREECRNPVGGLDDVSVRHHNIPGCNIAFISGEVKFVELEELPTLRWKLEGEEAIPPEWFERKYSDIQEKIPVFAGIGIVLAVAGAAVVVRYWTSGRLFFLFAVSIISGAAGAFFGSLSEMIYEPGEMGQAGLIAGAILGVYAGICYGAVLSRQQGAFKGHPDFTGYAVSLGMATGLICSLLVHLGLMIVFDDWSPDRIIMGMPFGIICGAVLGFLSSKALERFYPAEIPAGEQSGGEEINRGIEGLV